MCPHCRAVYPAVPEGRYKCGYCQKLLDVRRIDSAFGKAWATRSVPE